MAIINAKVGEFSLAEAMGIGLAKSLSEQILSPVIGNGSFFSGGVKLVSAWAVPKYLMKGNFGKMLGTAWAIDGVEDILNAVFKNGSSIDSTQKSNLI